MARRRRHREQGKRVTRTITACATIALLLAAARPAAAYTMHSLEPRERTAMLTTCLRLHGEDRALCRKVVDDRTVIANYKRSCLQAMTLLLQGTAWAVVKSLPPTITCRQGLSRAGYPVMRILRRLSGGREAGR